MLNKTFVQISITGLILLALFATPVSTRAGGACGGTYTIQQDETIDTLAATCGTTTSAIYAANPGISENLYAGQVLTIPSSNCANCARPIPTATKVTVLRATTTAIKPIVLQAIPTVIKAIALQATTTATKSIVFRPARTAQHTSCSLAILSARLRTASGSV